MSGAVTFVCGSVSDVHITKECGFIEMLDEGGAVMVDKGFTISELLKEKKVKLYMPPFRKENKFTKSQVETTRRIASARIHVERKMEQIKNYRILQGIMPLSLSGVADELFFVCAALTNLQPPLAK